MLFQKEEFFYSCKESLLCCLIRERKLHVHVYDKRQTSDSSWEFLNIENEQIKTAQNNSDRETIAWNYWLCVEIMNSKRQVMEKLGHVVQIRVCRLT